VCESSNVKVRDRERQSDQELLNGGLLIQRDRQQPIFAAFFFSPTLFFRLKPKRHLRSFFIVFSHVIRKKIFFFFVPKVKAEKKEKYVL
jgi:hypothetical protein